jgi:hypothetical protein
MTTFVLSWDHLGLEACVNITELDQRQMWEILSGQKKDTNHGRDHNINSIMGMLMIRARANSQRHYEIYAIDVDDTIIEEDLRAMFEDDPQGSADLIRLRGRQLYSDRVNENHIKIR